MADPATIMIGMTLLSAGASISASRAQTRMNQRAAEAEAQRALIAANNAAAVGSVQKEAAYKKIGLAESRARALAAASGVAISEDYFAGFAEKAEEQGQYIDWQARQQGAAALDRGQLGMWQAEAGGEIARTQEVATLLGAGAQSYGIYDKYKGA